MLQNIKDYFKRYNRRRNRLCAERAVCYGYDMHTDENGNPSTDMYITIDGLRIIRVARKDELVTSDMQFVCSNDKASCILQYYRNEYQRLLDNEDGILY